jgi:hypothetical protein
MVALDPASPKGLAEYAHQLNAMRKIVFSRTLSHVEWNNSTLVKEIVPEEIPRGVKRRHGDSKGADG